MNSKPLEIPELKLITPDVFPDARGAFLESYNREAFVAAGITDDFIQDNISISKRGVLRGLHFQSEPYGQSKLVSVVYGEVFDVAVDIREGSATRGKWVGVTLSGENHQMLYIPKGFAHGFLVVSEVAYFAYKVAGAHYEKSASTGIAWNDPTLGVNWPLNAMTPIVSEQDGKLPAFK